MNILILNWRDPLNSLSGGAEKLNLQILAPFIKKGDKVKWYSMREEDLSSNGQFGKIEIIRYGNRFTHFLLWPIFLWAGKFGKVDLIIDCIHGTGYYSPIFALGIKKTTVICEIAKNIWDEMLSFPTSNIGKFIEKHIMFKIYSSNTILTISESTKRDLIAFGVSSEKIKILPMGFNAPEKINKQKKYFTPTALFVGRLAEVKGIKDAIETIALLNSNSDKKWYLRIIGRGTDEFEQKLRDKVSSLGIKEYVKFLGYVSESKKFSEMSRAWILLVPSSREGWGMIVPEANYAGTQVVAYDSAGLRDSALNSSANNLIVDKTPHAMYECLRKIKKPLLINSNLKPGWRKLHEAINKYFTEI